MTMVRRWAIFRVSDDRVVQVGSHPARGLAAVEALRMAANTGVPHHIAEQIISRMAALEQYALPAIGLRSLPPV